MPSKPIVELGNPLLRKKSAVLSLDSHTKTMALIEDMVDTLNRAQGVGIAAPQIGLLHRIFLIAPEEDVLPIINPKLLGHSKKKIKDWEGCLSIPGIRGLVPRYETIQVSFQTPVGETLEMELTGFPARIFQHEYDHLEGIVFLDRMDSVRDIITDRWYADLMKAE